MNLKMKNTKKNTEHFNACVEMPFETFINLKQIVLKLVAVSLNFTVKSILIFGFRLFSDQIRTVVTGMYFTNRDNKKQSKNG